MTAHLHVLLLGICTALGDISCKKKTKNNMSPNLLLGSYTLTHTPSGNIVGEVFITGVFLRYANVLLLLPAKALGLSFL